MSRPTIVTLEEHFWDPELNIYMSGPAAIQTPQLSSRLVDFEDMRLREMDAAGIDMQVLSLTAPSLQNLPVAEAADVARRTNDKLADIVARRPDRFDAFAALPTPDPDAAVLELERSIVDLGFKGAMVAGLTHGRFIDDPRFHPLLAAAERLDVPLYIHPSWPHEALVKAYFGEYADRYPLTVRGVWGFTLETATQAFRLILSGIFAKHPRLKIFLGHMGEGLPFLLWRVNHTFTREQKGGRSFRDIFTNNFYITTSGFFSTPAFECVLAEFGVDHVMFSIDYPYMSIPEGMAWMNGVTLDPSARAKILGGNAIDVLRLKLR